MGIDIGIRQAVAMDATRPPGLPSRRRVTAQNVLSVSDRLEMVRVYAAANATEVIEF